MMPSTTWRWSRNDATPCPPTTAATARCGPAAHPRAQRNDSPRQHHRQPRPDIGDTLDTLDGASEHVPQDALDECELRRPGRQRWRKLQHDVPTVVGAAVQASLVQRRVQEGPDAVRLGVREAFPGLLVTRELDPQEVAGSADVTDDRDVVETLQGLLEQRPQGADAVDEALALEDFEVRESDSRGDRVPAEGVPVGEHVLPCAVRLVDTIRV